jgi:hypothetical protein
MRKTASKCNEVAETDAKNARSTLYQKALNQIPNALLGFHLGIHRVCGNGKALEPMML